MARAQGFARGDIDTAFPLDDKFLALRGSVSSERYYAAVGVYFTVVAATWREADRKVAAKVAPDAAQPIEDLQTAGLLDADGRVTSRAFTSWIGRARRQRKASTERQQRNRAQKTISHLEVGDRSSESGTQKRAQNSRAVTEVSRVTDRDTAGPAGTVGTVTEGTDTGESEGDALTTYWDLIGTYPSGKAKAWLEDLVNEFDHHRVSAALAAESKGDRQGLLGRTRDRLRSDADKAARANAEAQLTRLHEDAKAKRITPEQAAERQRAINEEVRRMTEKVPA